MNVNSLFDNDAESKWQLLAEKNAPVRQTQFEIEVNGQSVPVKIFLEPRFNNRVSVSRNGIAIRLSKYTPSEEQRKHIQNFLSWAKNKLGEKPDLLDYLPQRKYFDGEVLKVGNYIFTIHIIYHRLLKSTARLHQQHILLSLASGLTPEAEQNTASYLVSKCLAKFFQPIVHQRLHELNQKFFGKKINSVKLKYNTSNWGSCSSQGNINISVRLMFAPQDVVDYVLIHELAHLVYHNHSLQFWQLIEKIMPDYREKEKHLQENNFKYYL
jgi:predicted metal-dependent hydrolase